MDQFCKGCEYSIVRCKCNSSEKKRQANIARNEKFIKDNFSEFIMKPSPKKKKPKQSKLRQQYNSQNVRRSIRVIESSNITKGNSILKKRVRSANKYFSPEPKSYSQVQCPYCPKVLTNQAGLDATIVINKHCAMTKCHEKNVSINDASEGLDGDESVGNFQDEAYDEDDLFFSQDEGYDSEAYLQSLHEVVESYDETLHAMGEGEESGVQEEYEIEEVEQIDVARFLPNTDQRSQEFPVVLNSRQAKKYQSELFTNPDPRIFVPNDDIMDWQNQMAGLFTGSRRSVKFRNRNQGGQLQAVEWMDLAKIYEFGVAMNFSDAQGTMMLQLMQDMFDRHPGTNIQLRSTWASLKRAIQKQKTEKAFEKTNYTLPLPVEYFGEMNHVTNRPLKPYRTTGVNVFCIIADRLLNLSHSDNLITKWREDEGIPREHQILGDYCTGDTFQKISKWYETFPLHEGLEVVPILLEITWDDTTTSGSQAESECPVYARIINIENEENEYYLIGFAPRRCPYSQSQLHAQLLAQGVDIKSHRVSYVVIYL